MDTIITLLVAALVLFAGVLLVGCDADDTDDADDSDADDPKDNKEAQENEGTPSLDVNPDVSQDGPFHIADQKPYDLTSGELCEALIETGFVNSEPEFQTLGTCIDFFNLEFSVYCKNYNAFMHCSENIIKGLPLLPPALTYTMIVSCVENYCE